MGGDCLWPRIYNMEYAGSTARWVRAREAGGMEATRIVIDHDYRIGGIARRPYGSFIEHMGRVVCGGRLTAILPKLSWNDIRLARR